MFRKQLILFISFIIKKLVHLQCMLAPKRDNSWQDNPNYSEPEYTSCLDPVKNWHHHPCKRCRKDGAPHKVLDKDKYYYPTSHHIQCRDCDRKDACLPKKSFLSKLGLKDLLQKGPQALGL